MMRRWIHAPILICLLLTWPAHPAASADVRDVPPPTTTSIARFDGDLVIRTHLRTIRELMVMLAVSDDPWSETIGVGTVDWRVSVEALDAVREAEIAYEILIPDVQALIDAERARIEAFRAADHLFEPDWYEEYKDYDEVNARLDELIQLRPDLVTPFDIGESLRGRTVRGIRITAPGNDGIRPAILVNGCQHAREWISVMVTMYIADALVRQANTDSRIAGILATTEIIIIPIVNPDGYVYSWTNNRLWRKNRRDNGDGTFGVDPNRNWSFAWGGPGSSNLGGSEIYHGTEPFSEPETANLRDFILDNPGIVGHLDVHSFSQLILQPWAWTADLPIDHLIFDDLGASMVEEIDLAGGVPYIHGATAPTLYVASGGMADWTYGDRDIVGLTIELRDTGQFGFILPPEQIIPSGEEFLPAFMRFAEFCAEPAAFAWPLGEPVTIDADQDTPLALLIRPIAAEIDASTAVLRWRPAGIGAYASEPLQTDDGLTYIGFFPPIACSTVIEYFIEVETTEGVLVRTPSDAPNAPLTALALQTTRLVDDDMSKDLGWIVGAPDDDATTGIWDRVDPIGTFVGGVPVQPNAAFIGELCWVTGQHLGGGAGTNDVDNGKTTLTTPRIDLSNVEPWQDVTISYVRWYSNAAGANPNNDIFVVDISADDGATWTNVEIVGPAGPETNGGWFHVHFDPRTLIPLTEHVRLRFVASDYDPQALVEAALDLFRVTLSGCPSVPALGDLNSDGLVDLTDLLILLSAWGPCTPDVPCPADLDGNGTVDLSDLLLLLSNWSN